MTFLAIDVGNSRLKWALYAAARPGAALLAHGVEFLDHIERLADGQWADLPAPTHMLGCVVAGDAVKRRVAEQMDLWDVPARWVVPSAEEAGVVNGYDHPSRLGADRWVAMIGARQRIVQRGSPRPLIAAAGGVTPANAAAYAQAGADVLVSSAPYSAAPKDVAVSMQALDAG